MSEDQREKVAIGEDQYRKEGWYVYSGCFNYRKKPTISPGSYYAEHGLPKTVIPA